MLAAERARELYGRAFHELVRQVLHFFVVGAVNESLLLGSCWSSRCQLHPMPAHLHTLWGDSNTCILRAVVLDTAL